VEPDLTLYGFPGSLCSQKVRLALAEKQLAYQSRTLDIELRMQNYEPWYLRLNPRGVVPTLVHGDRVVTDSAQILRYIDDTFDGPSLTPESQPERASMEAWIDEQDAVKMRELSYASFKGMLGIVLRNVSMPLRLAKLRRMRDREPDLAGTYAAKIDDVAQWRADIASREEVDTVRRELETVLRRADEQLGRTRHLAADTYSLADVAWTCVLARLRMLGLAEALWGAERLPHLATYYETLRQRPSFVEADIWEAPPSLRVRRALLKEAITGSRLGAEKA